MKILLVDDKKENRYLLEKLLQGNGYETLSAANGAEALVSASNNPPDMVVSDILMPVMDGFTLCREWRKNKILKNIPFVFYTATYTDPKDEEFALSVGADRFIVKPQGMNDFLQIISEIFDAYKAQEIRPIPVQISEEQVFLKEYNDTLVRRLEEKMKRVEAAEKELREKNAALEQDIEERKHAEKALAHEQFLMQTLMNNVPDHIYFKDRESRFVRMNKSQSMRFGLSDPAEAVGKTDFDFFADEHARPAFEDEQKIMQTGLPLLGVEEKETWPDGSVTWVTTTKMPLRDTQGGIIGTFGISKDITKSKQAEQALLESEAKYRTLVTQSPDGIFIVNLLGDFLSVNKAMCDILKYSEEELLSMKIWNIVPQQYLALHKERITAIIKGENTKEVAEYEVKGKDGISHFIEVLSAPYYKEREIIGFQGIARDITERKRAEETLRETRDYLENLLSFANAPIIVWDPDFKITRFNLAIEKLTGYTGYDVVGKHLDMLFPVESRKSSVSLIAPTTGGDHLITVEIPILCKNGSTRIVLWSTANIYAADGRTLISTIAQGQDITEQKKLQQELHQSQKMQSIGTLAGGIAHDFNNILGIILGYTARIERETLSPEKLRESIGIINNAVGRGAALVGQILTFARKTDVVIEPINVPDLIHELLAMLRQTFPRVITFIDIVDKKIPFIKADRIQIHQVLMNLCVNARDAMPNGGTLTIKTDKQTKIQVQERFRAADQDSYLCISVTDTGEGMNEATLHQIFDPFFTTKEQGKGTGLGLAVVYGAVQSHHGFIDVESEVGRGTTFRLYFPIPPTSEQSSDVSLSTGSFTTGGTETILLVEDEEVLLEIVRLMLESNGYKVHTAKDGNEAIRVYKKYKQKIDLVLTDMGLSGMTGMDVFKTLKKVNPKIKVIVASGFIEPDVKSELEKIGTKGFIQKPYSPDEVLRLLREVLDAKNDSV